MASLSKSKTLFGFTSPRSVEKILPEIDLLNKSFSGQEWDVETQTSFFNSLYHSEFYEAVTYPSNPALAARDRITRAPKAFGFVDLKPNISITKAGEMLLSDKMCHEIFAKQMLKFQLPSPYHTQSKNINFCVKPYLELLRLIERVESLSKTEIALFFLQLTSFDKFDVVVNKIMRFREGKKHFKGSYKAYVSECFEAEIRDIYADNFVDETYKTRQSSNRTLKKFVDTKISNMKDYADAFFRCIRATELVTLQRKSFRLVVPSAKKDEVKYILQTVDRSPFNFSNIDEFKKYLFDPDSIKLFLDDKKNIIKKLNSLGEFYFNTGCSVERLKELLETSTRNLKDRSVQNQKNLLKEHEGLQDIFDVFDAIKNKDVPDAPLFLEWNVWRALVRLNYAIRIDGNFVVDIDGMPLNYAPGNKPDIESEYEEFGVITEVTMSRGNTQYAMEGESVPRHYGKARANLGKDMYCLFIAPKISEGSLAHFFNLNRINTKLYGGKTKIIPLSIDQFIQFVKIGVRDEFNDPSTLKKWLDERCAENQIVEDEEVWFRKISDSISEWTK